MKKILVGLSLISAALFASYIGGGGSGGGISSINGDKNAAQAIIAGSNITVSTAAGSTTVTSSGGGVSSVGAFGGASTANAASVSGSVLTMTPADGTNPGALTTSAQTIAGQKTFNSQPILAGGNVSKILVSDASHIISESSTTPTILNYFNSVVNTNGGILAGNGTGFSTITGTTGQIPTKQANGSTIFATPAAATVTFPLTATNGTATLDYNYNTGSGFTPLTQTAGSGQQANYIMSTGAGFNTGGEQSYIQMIDSGNRYWKWGVNAGGLSNNGNLGIVTAGLGPASALNVMYFNGGSGSVMITPDSLNGDTPQAGANGSAQVGGTIHASATVGSNAADTTDDTLGTYTIPAKVFTTQTNSRGLKIHAAGIFAANTDVKDVKVWVNGTAVADTTALVLNGGSWVFELSLPENPVTTNNLQVNGIFNSSSAALPVTTFNTSVGVTFTSSFIVKVTGASTVSAAAADITMNDFRIDWYGSAN